MNFSVLSIKLNNANEIYEIRQKNHDSKNTITKNGSYNTVDYQINFDNSFQDLIPKIETYLQKQIDEYHKHARKTLMLRKIRKVWPFLVSLILLIIIWLTPLPIFIKISLSIIALAISFGVIYDAINCIIDNHLDGNQYFKKYVAEPILRLDDHLNKILFPKVDQSNHIDCKLTTDTKIK